MKRLYATSDKHFVEVVRHTSWALVLLIGITIIQFFFDFSLTHTFGAHGSGIFYLCFSVLMVLALIGRLGVDRAVVRFIPPLLADDPGAAAGVQRTATQLSLALTIPLALLLFILAPFLSRTVFNSADLAVYLRIFAFAIPPLALNYVYSGILRSLKRTQAALSIERLTMYGLGIFAVVILGNIYGLKGAAVGFVLAIFATTAEGTWYLKRYMPKYKSLVPFSRKRMLVVSAPLLFVVFALQMSGQASVLLLGAYSSRADLSIFNIALRVSMLMNLILSAVSVIMGTKISELHAARKKEELERIIGKVSALGALIGIPTFIVLSILAPFLLGLFGKAFPAGTSTLIVLAAGQLVNVVVGPTLFILSMTGHERALALAIGSSLILNVLLGLILIPSYDALGAGIATSAAITASNLAMMILVKRYLGVWSLPFKYLGLWLKVKKVTT